MSAELANQARSFLEEAGYDSDHLVANYAFTSRRDDGNLANDRADLVAFGGAPHTMRTACVSVVEPETAASRAVTVSRLRFLTAPLAIVGAGPSVELWSIRRHLEPEPFKTAPRAAWPDAFCGRLADLSPDTILEAKRGETQLEFVDVELGTWAERMTGFDYWFMASLTIPHALAGGLMAVVLAHPARGRRKLGLCLNCGYDLRASEERCPECGSPIAGAMLRSDGDPA